MKKRFIEYQGRQWHLRALAAQYMVHPGTLHYRISRFGETTSGLTRALTTGLVSRSEAGRRGALASPWNQALV